MPTGIASRLRLFSSPFSIRRGVSLDFVEATMLEMLKGNFGCGIANGVDEAPGRGEKAALLLWFSPGEGGGKGEVANGEKGGWFQVQDDGADKGPDSPAMFPVTNTSIGRL
jgi:hypothetical protein